MELPIGKALVAIETLSGSCHIGNEDCYFLDKECPVANCAANNRTDGKSIIYRLVDYPDARASAWISLADKQPEVKEDEYDCPLGKQFLVYCAQWNQIDLVFWSNANGFGNFPVTHWQPLPQFPEAPHAL
ncbi:DUF551 domain-containing protein [Treponema primitia]|uniref:hypothetical protein n=1 Tax=Treponema primitia TaxID=88058 RepID=UPI0039802DAC